MQCFQKDPNLRVSARKLLRHAWIVGCRRADAPVSKAPDNFTQAVEEVKQWNKALESSEPNLRASGGSDTVGQMRYTGGTPAKGPLSLAKPKPGAEAFLTPELADDDNWDDDFATAISPSALHLPHLKPQDNFGGLLSSDRLKAFASANERHENYDDDFDGELLTIKGNYQDFDSQEQTIRPTRRFTEKALVKSPKTHHRAKSSSSKAAGPAGSSHQNRSPPKSHFNKFELPARPDVYYREQSVEDYSDLFVDNDSVFNRKPNEVKKVRFQGFERFAWC